MVSSTARPPIPRVDQELISPDSPLAGYVSVNSARLHGEPCFRGTRVPIQILFDHLRGGEQLDDFLAGFPDVQREQAVAVIDLAAMGFLAGLRNL
jgi:uncharacterized protein (DUF433 family)